MDLVISTLHGRPVPRTQRNVVTVDTSQHKFIQHIGHVYTIMLSSLFGENTVQTYRQQSCSHITRLYLNDCRLSTLPDFLPQLTHVQILGLDSNVFRCGFSRLFITKKPRRLVNPNFGQVPDIVAKFGQLSILYLNDNIITSLNGSVFDVKQLKSLWIERYYRRDRLLSHYIKFKFGKE